MIYIYQNPFLPSNSFWFFTYNADFIDSTRMGKAISTQNRAKNAFKIFVRKKEEKTRKRQFFLYSWDRASLYMRDI
jgi:hypothetical protein